MARRVKEVDLGEKKILVKELTVKQIRKFWSELNNQGIPDLSSMMTGGPVSVLWDACIDGLVPDDMENMAPSEIKAVYDAVIEVNTVFFDQARRFEEENPAVKEYRSAIAQDLRMMVWQSLTGLSAASSNEDTQESSNTDTPSS